MGCIVSMHLVTMSISLSWLLTVLYTGEHTSFQMPQKPVFSVILNQPMQHGHLITIPLILGATLTTLVQSDERQRSCWLTIANDMKTIFPTLDCFINNSGAICDLITSGFSEQERLFINKVYPHRLKDDPPDSEETVIAKAVKRKLSRKRNNYRDRLQLYMFRNDHSELVTFYI